MQEISSQSADLQEKLNAVTDKYQIKPMGDEPMVIADAQGFRVTDAAGKEYLDGISGEWVVNLGYRNPEVAEAAIAQIMRSDFIAPMYNAEPRALLAEKVVEMAPGMSKLLFGLSGSDAVEGAMHLAMRSRAPRRASSATPRARSACPTTTATAARSSAPPTAVTCSAPDSSRG